MTDDGLVFRFTWKGKAVELYRKDEDGTEDIIVLSDPEAVRDFTLTFRNFITSEWKIK